MNWRGPYPRIVWLLMAFNALMWLLVLPLISVRGF